MSKIKRTGARKERRFKSKVTPAKRREFARQRRYFADDIEQPLKDNGRPNPKFEKLYGKYKLKPKFDSHDASERRL